MNLKHSRPHLNTEYIMPENDIQKKLCLIWEDLLHFDKIGIDDDFFNLGGDSLIGTKLFSRIRDKLDIEMDLSSIFDHPTIRKQSSEIEIIAGKNNRRAVVIDRETGEI
jgi:hypothetical protein